MVWLVSVSLCWSTTNEFVDRAMEIIATKESADHHHTAQKSHYPPGNHHAIHL